ncbi:hypothetical protein LRF89_06530 [Halorhodospira sp. 9621]|uniref:hypothetical protein n=1 Tax=Halorhodospira sp. 9621 TaxID=2899135 RepID=UPI001EE84E48|nr:hypothetical protein [Halorhodospira sp. 9621]MCG5533096.1 hypothetical protein [Halorhodospira sp. 9621]
MSGGRSAARRERRRMREAQEQANKLAAQRLKWAQGQMDEYNDLYGDLENRMIAEAERGAHADYAGVTDRAAADVSQQFERQREDERRRMAAFGIDPSSGRFQGMDRRAGLAEATATAGTVNQARRAEHERAQSRTDALRGGAMSMGSQRFSMAHSATDAAHAGRVSAKQNTASMHQAEAGSADARAAGTGQMIGTVVGGVAGAMVGGPAGAMAGASIGGAAMGGGGGGGSVPYTPSAAPTAAPASGNTAGLWQPNPMSNAQVATHAHGTPSTGFGLSPWQQQYQ